MNHGLTLMSSGEVTDHGLMFSSETGEIIGAAMEVLNVLGHGLLEKPYENALAVEFRLRSIPFVLQPQYEVMYKDVRAGLYVPDLFVHGCGGGHQGHRQDQQSRERADAQLPWLDRTSGRPHPQFQTRQIGMAKSRSVICIRVYQCPSVVLHSIKSHRSWNK